MIREKLIPNNMLEDKFVGTRFRVGYSRGYGDIISHEILRAHTKSFRKFTPFFCILGLTGYRLLLGRKFLLATGIFYQCQESYIL